MIVACKSVVKHMDPLSNTSGPEIFICISIVHHAKGRETVV